MISMYIIESIDVGWALALWVLIWVVWGSQPPPVDPRIHVAVIKMYLQIGEKLKYLCESRLF